MTKNSNTQDSFVEESIDQEKEELKIRLRQLEEKINSFLSAPNQNIVTVEKTTESTLTSDDYINVISLIFIPLTISTLGLGKGHKFDFSYFGQIKSILYGDIVGIIENQQSFLENGYFYIMDKRVIRRHGLDEIYNKILNKEKIDEILTWKKDVAIPLYESAPQAQREMINTALILKIIEGEKIDLNVIDAISRIGGVNLVEKASYTKDLLEKEKHI